MDSELITQFVIPTEERVKGSHTADRHIHVELEMFAKAVVSDSSAIGGPEGNRTPNLFYAIETR